MVKKHDRVTRSCSILAQIGYEVACMQHLSRSASSSCNVSDWLRGRTHASFIRQRQQQQLQRLGLVTRSHARSIYRVAPAAAVAVSQIGYEVACTQHLSCSASSSCNVWQHQLQRPVLQQHLQRPVLKQHLQRLPAAVTASGSASSLN